MSPRGLSCAGSANAQSMISPNGLRFFIGSSIGRRHIAFGHDFHSEIGVWSEQDIEKCQSKIERDFPYIVETAVRSSSGRPSNAPAAFIYPCRPVVSDRPPSGAGWAHEIKHDGYRLQIHVRDGRVRLYTMTGADRSKRYPLIFQHAARVKDSAIFDAEVVWLGSDGVADFEALRSGANDAGATAARF